MSDDKAKTVGKAIGQILGKSVAFVILTVTVVFVFGFDPAAATGFEKAVLFLLTFALAFR